jgi:hypothetical protein
MKKNLLSNICLALALLMTVYHFVIVDVPVSKQVTGVILLLVIASNVITNLRYSK